MVRAVVETAKGGATAVRRPWLGARVQSVTPDIAESMGLDHPTGVLVAARKSTLARAATSPRSSGRCRPS